MRSLSAQERRAALLREFEGSGLSMAEFCRRREIGYSTMASWRKAGLRKAAPCFVEVETLPVSPPGVGGAGTARAKRDFRCAGAVLAELVLPGGAVLRVYQQSAGHGAQEGGAG